MERSVKGKPEKNTIKTSVKWYKKWIIHRRAKSCLEKKSYLRSDFMFIPKKIRTRSTEFSTKSTKVSSKKTKKAYFKNGKTLWPIYLKLCNWNRANLWVFYIYCSYKNTKQYASRTSSKTPLASASTPSNLTWLTAALPTASQSSKEESLTSKLPKILKIMKFWPFRTSTF